ncbi:hypothetical protein SBA4_3530009 [Candidatus Sulfopaludibacter sp. SbA4]|nr:hypothetical protein SBA4_3530009 [Candidatus Sulfopaludibacter sp. SbA4]
MSTRLPVSCLIAGFCVCFWPGNLWPADTNLELFSPSAVPIGGVFKINNVPTPPTSFKPTARMYRNGTKTDKDPTVDFPSITLPPDHIELGNYQVIVQLDKGSYTGEIRVRPPGTAEITLNKFDPDQTNAVDTIWIKPDDPAKPGAHATSLRVVNLTLRGTGFIQDTPQDNTIWINEVRQDIHWDDYAKVCTPEALNVEGAVPWGIRGQVVSSEEIKLCHVPVPENRVIEVRAGYGDKKSDAQTFTVYWLGTAKVALMAFAITAVLAGLIFLLISIGKPTYQIAGENYKWSLLFLDQQTDTYSLSKFQFYLWTLAAIFTYAYLYISKVFVQGGYWPDIPGTLPGIVGIGAGTAIGSQVVTAANGAKGSGPEKPGFLDFITSGGAVAADRIQMFLWTLFGVGAFCLGVLQKSPGTITAIQPVPDGMMYMMGLSSVGYLGGKMARKPGPVITELTVTPGQSDQALAQAASAAIDLPDLGQASVTAASHLNSLPKAANANAQKAIDTLGGAIKAAGAVHTTSDVATLLTSLSGFRRDCEAAAAAAAADFAATPAKATSQEAAAAQQAAAFLQDFSSDVTQAIAAAAIPAMDSAASSGSVARVIEMRGSNLAFDGTFEIGNADLPFRMLINQDGQNLPDVIARQDGGNFATILRFTIDPARLEATDLAQYQAWFGADAKWLASLTNPDGQKADQSFSLPPATVTPQKS